MFRMLLPLAMRKGDLGQGDWREVLRVAFDQRDKNGRVGQVRPRLPIRAQPYLLQPRTRHLHPRSGASPHFCGRHRGSTGNKKDGRRSMGGDEAVNGNREPLPCSWATAVPA